MTLDRGFTAFRLLTAALVAIGFAIGGATLGAAPARADNMPWYMPQSWMYPKATGPKFRYLPGYYGYKKSLGIYGRTYGGFSNGCYGACGARIPGMVRSGYNVVLYRPNYVIYDQGAYQLVPRSDYIVEQPSAYVAQTAAPVQPAIRHVPTKAAKPWTIIKAEPNFIVQNGVRVIRPAPLPN